MTAVIYSMVLNDTVTNPKNPTNFLYIRNYVGGIKYRAHGIKKIGVEATKAAMLSVHGERRNCLTQLSNGLIHHYRCPNARAAAKVMLNTNRFAVVFHRRALRKRVEGSP